MASGVASIPLPGVALGPGSGGALDCALRSFYAGPENLLVGVAVEAVLDPLRPRFSPLLLLGPSGVGKTHLALGLARRWSETGRTGEVICLTGGDFASQLAAAIDDDTIRTFRARLRTAALFVLDDLAKLAKKPAAQKELLLTLDALERAGAAAVVTSRLLPAEMPQLLPGLMSRLTGGLVLTLAAPGSAARRAILEELAAVHGIALAPRAAETLANELAANAPELLRVLLQLSPSRAAIDPDRAERYVADRNAQNTPSVAAIIAVTAKHYALKVADLKSTSRNRTIATARSIAMYLIRKLSGQSLEQIGRAFGGRDHTTVLHSCRKVEKQLETDPNIRLSVGKIEQELGQRG